MSHKCAQLDFLKRDAERERERVGGIVIALACDREKTLIVGKLDCAYEKVWKHSVSLGKSDISSQPRTAVNQTTDR